MELVGIIPESGEVLTHYLHMFNKTDTSCCQIKMGMVAYLGGDHHMFNKTDTTCNMSMWVWCLPGCCVDPISGYQMLSSYFYVSQVSRQTYIKTMQPRPFEEWIKKGHQRDTNLCGAYVRPTNKSSLVKGRGGYNQGSFVYFAEACGGVEGRAVLSDGWDKPRCAPGTGSFIDKNRDDYKVQGCGWGESGSEVWLYTRVL